MSSQIFDAGQFADLVRVLMTITRTNQKAVAEQTGINKSTLCRILRGDHLISAENYFRLKGWMKQAKRGRPERVR